jgi:transposase
MSTGDRTILGRISKRGNRYLRTLFMQGARVILLRPANWAKHSFGPWLTPRRNGCIIVFWQLRLPTSWRASPGRY